MSDPLYAKDPVDHVLAVLKDALGERFNYVNGMMDAEIPESLLPTVMATISDGTINSGASGQDDIEEKLTVTIAVNVKDYIGGDDSAADADVALRRMFMGIDPTTGQYLPESVMYALRKNFTLEGGVVENSLSFDFEPVQRGEHVFTQEATIQMTVKRMAQVPSRN